ncbi:MAG TPA: glutamine-hydrolyzing GMP synthase [Blastocatellia bacterium]|jgi:GMP synthase (glutamine-hydrolysing)|nr:glutamine-hydrolyzing GMP synthase [Blastocatellia bacterium]
MTSKHETVIILDFGGQYTQLIARKVRELGVYSEIVPFNISPEELRRKEPRAIILSGGPSSVYDAEAPHPDRAVIEMGVPVLGICYGVQLMAYFLGGEVKPSSRREYGSARIDHQGNSMLLAGLPSPLSVWMSHGDYVSSPPEGFKVTAATEAAIGAVEDSSRNLYGVQFHPEVAHTPQGKDVLRNFLVNICHLRCDWTMASFIETTIADIRSRVGEGQAVCGLSGGVDSSVAAALVARAIGERQTCIFVDTGLLRKNEFEEVLDAYREMDLNVIGVAKGERFLTRLAGITDPERKRKIIGNEFIEVFQEEARRLGQVDYLVQGTLYPDVIESVSVKGPSAVIKSHHNVGGLPEKMHLKLIEPLRELFKDEVRRVGRELGLPEEIVGRQPFPGPGLAVRILGEVTSDRVALLQEADAIVIEEMRRADLYDKVWQSFAVLLPVSTVGVMGDCRTYDNAVTIRAVESVDGMTADWARLPYDVLQRISSRIVSEVRGINRVVYDISSKPPSTIEWE